MTTVRKKILLGKMSYHNSKPTKWRICTILIAWAACFDFGVFFKFEEHENTCSLVVNKCPGGDSHTVSRGWMIGGFSELVVVIIIR